MNWLKKIVALICMVLVAGFVASMSEISSEENEKVIDQKSRITLDSLENVSTNELSQQILDFINEHPDKREKLIDYVFNVKLLNNQTKDRSEEKYKQSLIDAVTDYSMIFETAEEFSNSGIVTKKVADRWQSESIPAEDDFELYNAKLKIAELNRRFFEARIDLKDALDDQTILDSAGFNLWTAESI